MAAFLKAVHAVFTMDVRSDPVGNQVRGIQVAEENRSRKVLIQRQKRRRVVWSAPYWLRKHGGF
jgi:hypothetical protein